MIYFQCYRDDGRACSIPLAWNIRELQNFVGRAVILSPHSVLRAPSSELEPFNSHREFHLPISGLAQVEEEKYARLLDTHVYVSVKCMPEIVASPHTGIVANFCCPELRMPANSIIQRHARIT